MTWVMVDVESDGPCPGLYSMVSFGAVIVAPALNRTFYSDVLRPLHAAESIPEALAISGVTREQQLAGAHPLNAMQMFRDFLNLACRGRPMFVSDNNGFDWQFINYYFHMFCGGNPFGFSSTNLGSLYKGLVKDSFKNFKHLRKTKHSHHPVDDARGNAEAMLHMDRQMGLKLGL